MKRVVIAGGGLSGLYAAWVLERQGVQDYLLLEAQDTVGGRILSRPPAACAMGQAPQDRFDLGATWYWPQFQPELQQLIQHLGLSSFEQPERGDALLEQAPGATPLRMRGYATGSMRLAGGMQALTLALLKGIDPQRIQTSCVLRQMQLQDDHVVLSSAAGQHWQAEHVLLAMPPRLVLASLTFEAELPPSLLRSWAGTPTWMAPHAKYLAVFEQPFWRSDGLSGAVRSSVGPLHEIHDASAPEGHAALFGFFGIPAAARRRIGTDGLRAACRLQLQRLFGPDAAKPVVDYIKDWADDPYLATPADLRGAAAHVAAPAAFAESGPWRGRLTGIASEWSPSYPGYIAGAIDAAAQGVRAFINTRT